MHPSRYAAKVKTSAAACSRRSPRSSRTSRRVRALARLGGEDGADGEHVDDVGSERREGAPETSAPTQRWLRAPEAAAYLRLGVGTLNKLRIYGGGPPFCKLGSVVVYDIDDLDRWASERKVRSTSQRPCAD